MTSKKECCTDGLCWNRTKDHQLFCEGKCHNKNCPNRHTPSPDSWEEDEYAWRGDENKCSDIIGHVVDWCGDCYACATCGLIFVSKKTLRTTIATAVQEEGEKLRELELNSDDWKQLVEEIRTQERERIGEGLKKLLPKDGFALDIHDAQKIIYSPISFKK